MNMFRWIKRQLNYKARYEELLQQRDSAASHALYYMGLYDALCASLPSDHKSSASTIFRWKEYANKRLMLENADLKRSLDAQTERLDDMLTIWTNNHVKYGWSPPPKEKSDYSA